MKSIRTQDAVGHALIHDLVRIVIGEVKDTPFRRGHVITEEDIPKDYYDRFSWLQLPLMDCLYTAEGIRKFPVRGIVIDAFSEPVEIDKGAFEAIRQS